MVLASIAESTLPSSPTVVRVANLSESHGTSVPEMVEASAPESPVEEKPEQTRTLLRNRLNSSSSFFFSCNRVALSAERVSIKTEQEINLIIQAEYSEWLKKQTNMPD